MTIYQPSDDSYLLQDAIKKILQNKKKEITILDLGSGSGILAKTCIDMGYKNILASDIDEEVIISLKKQKINTIQSDLFEKIKQKFDLIIFNPPYLPEDADEPIDSRLQTTAGKQGYELIVKFLKQAKSHLNNKGEILLLFSSLSRPDIIKKHAKELRYSMVLINKKKLFFEELYVYLFKLDGK